jgi:beta-lactam-binding protein with PASTA domain
MPVTVHVSDGNPSFGASGLGSASGGAATGNVAGGGTSAGGHAATGEPNGGSNLRVFVPSVRGLKLDDATRRLASAGFRIDPSTLQQSDSSIPRGFVIDTNPPSGSSQQEHSQLTLIVSSGPNVLVPNVLGMTEQDATGRLKSDGFTVVVTQKAFPPGPGTPAPGHVADTHPTHDSPALAGSQVELVVVAPYPGITPTPSSSPKT